MSSATSDNVNFASDYKVRRSKNTAGEGIQHVRLDIGSGTTESQVTSLAGIPTTTPNTILRVEVASATITYIGKAAIGAATSAASWRIQRVDTTSGTVILFGGGSGAYDQIWDNRAGLSYS